MRTATLNVNCSDAKGIVYHVTQFIFEQGGNIIHAQQHREELDNRFFMRVHFDCTDVAASDETLRSGIEALAGQFAMDAALTFSDTPKRMAVLVSRYDHCLYDLFLRRQYGEIDAEIAVVVSNHPDLQGVVEHFGVPFQHIPVVRGQKGVAEQEALRVFGDHGVDFVVLARYMQILSPLLVDAYRHRIINVHHGFLPAFKGAKPYHQAYEKGVKLVGATSHYVTEDLDMGPIIAQEVVPVHHGHSVDDLVAMGRDVEKSVLAEAVKAHADDRIMVYRHRTIVFD